MTSIASQLIAQGLRSAFVTRRRSLREWVESEVLIPDGPFKGERFKISRQPFVGLLFDAIDKHEYTEYFVCGPSQTGKTLAAHVLPLVYTLAELRRNCVCAVPDMRMANNKWEIDFLPVFNASPTLGLLRPTKGPGSRGGQVKDAVRLENGSVLKWMTAGGDDTQRAGFTADGGVYVTEAARFSAGGESSVESDPLDQLRARMQATARRRRRLIVEGTATIEAELPYSGRPLSTQSRIVIQCPHCGEYVTPEREHLVGWQQAASELEAAELAHYICPACTRPWSEEDRRWANEHNHLLHAGQSIDRKSQVTGDAPKTERLWFRWNMANNLLLSAGDVAVDEWKAKQLEPETEAAINAEKKLRQFVWALPYVPSSLDAERLTSNRVGQRQTQYPRGMAPEDTQWITIGIDLGKYALHWVAIAWRMEGVATVIDYGIADVPTRKGDADATGMDVEQAIMTALSTMRERFEDVGFTRHGSGQIMLPDRVLIDSGWKGEAVFAWLRSINDGRATLNSPYVACKGFGVSQHERRQYSRPTKKGGEVLHIGERYHVSRFPTEKAHQIQIDSDHWKSWLHDRLKSESGKRGSLDLFSASAREHQTYTKHLTNEHAVDKPVPGFGLLRVWINPQGKPNHFLDATSYACVGGKMCGFTVIEESTKATPSPASEESSGDDDQGPVLPDGRAFYDFGT